VVGVYQTGNLADTLRQSGDVTGAEKLYRRALEITTAAFGENHPEVSTSINNLANCVKDKGDLDEAELLFRRALAIQEATHGPRGGDWTTLTNNLVSAATLPESLRRVTP
jgi:Tfp pilus assembly protein PilF